MTEMTLDRALDMMGGELRHMRGVYHKQGWSWNRHETLDWLVRIILSGPWRLEILQDARVKAYCKEQDRKEEAPANLTWMDGPL